MDHRLFFLALSWGLSLPLCAKYCNLGGIDGVRWSLASFGWTRIAVPANAWIRLAAGRIEGGGGCNALGGSYRLHGSLVRLSLAPSTQMACPAIGMESRFRGEC